MLSSEFYDSFILIFNTFDFSNIAPISEKSHQLIISIICFRNIFDIDCTFLIISAIIPTIVPKLIFVSLSLFEIRIMLITSILIVLIIFIVIVGIVSLILWILMFGFLIFWWRFILWRWWRERHTSSSKRWEWKSTTRFWKRQT